MAVTAAKMLSEMWGLRIRRKRGQRSQEWLARQIGVDQTTISRIERGEYRLYPELMVGLAVALDCATFGELFEFPPGLLDMEKFKRDSKHEVVA